MHTHVCLPFRALYPGVAIPAQCASRSRTWRVALLCLAIFALQNLGAGQSVVPTSLSFGNVAVGLTTSAKNVTLTNGRKFALAISGITIDLPDFSQTNNCPTRLNPGASCTISVTFTPATAGSRHGSLTITDTTTQKVSLAGNGILDVAASPTSLAFGNVIVGRKSGAKTVTVKNNQPVAVTLNSVTSSLPDYVISSNSCPLSPSTLVAGGSCKINIIFSPTTLGSRNADLTIANNSNNNPTVALAGTGIPPVSVSPGGLTFSGQALGTVSAVQTVILTNNQTTQLTINSISSSLGDFGVSSSCPSKLAAGASCSVGVAFAPAATGNRNATLSFLDNASNTPQTVSLAGMGLPPILISIAVTPSNPSISAGSTEQFAATGSYTDGSQQDLSGTAIWTSSSAGVAAVSATGLATSAGAGSTTISASSGTVSGSTLLTVTPGATILSRIPERICMTESESFSSVSCTLAAPISSGNGVVAFITSTASQTLATGSLQDSKGNTYSILGTPVSGGYATIYSAYSQLATALQAGDVLTLNVPASDSWGIALYDIGPVQGDQPDTGITFQNQNSGPSDMINPDTGVPGWWTGQTAKTTGADMCLAAIGVGSANYAGNTGNGTPPSITLFNADNSFRGLNITQTYGASDPNYANGGAILTLYSEVPAGTAAQSHVITYDTTTNTAPAALYCFKEAPGPVKSIPWFTGNYCTGTMSCTIDNVVPGDMLVIGSHSYINLPPAPIVVTDSQPESVTFDQLDASLGLGSWHISPVVNGGSHTISINDSVDPNIGMVVVEIAGQASGNPVEAVAQASILESSQTFATITTQTPDDLIFGWGRSYYGSDEGEGFTAIRVMPTAEFAVAPGVGAQAVTLHPRGTPPWTETGIQAMAIRPAGTVAPAIVSPSFTGNYCIGTYPDTTCTLNNVAAGDMLVISSLAGGSLTEPPVIHDSVGELIIPDRGNDSDGAITLSTWHIAPVLTAGTHTITIEGSVTVVITEYTGQSQSSPIDALTAVTQSSGGFASATVQTSQGNDLIYAWCGTDSQSGWGDGFAAFWTTPTSEYRMAGPNAGPETATCPSSPENPAAGWIIQEIAIRH